MNYREIVERIPMHYRDEIIATNMINNAQPVVQDPNMNYLAIVWHDYVDNTTSTTCNVCMAQLLNHWRSIQATLLLMQKDTNLLNSLR